MRWAAAEIRIRISLNHSKDWFSLISRDVTKTNTVSCVAEFMKFCRRATVMLSVRQCFRVSGARISLQKTSRRVSVFPNTAKYIRFMKGLIQYFYEIKVDKAILWCYFIWYVAIVYFYFEPLPKIWINSIGISAVIGTGLLLSVSSGKIGGNDRWQTFRLYLMQFCVSSFSALIKDRGFIVFISPKVQENLLSILCCSLFLLGILGIKSIKNKIT
jgi:hypothetical protein